MEWHAGQRWGELWRGIPSQYLKQQQDSLSCMCSPRVSEGTQFCQSPVCGRAVEFVRAWALVVGAVDCKAWKTVSSMAHERWHWHSGTSTFSRLDQLGWAAEVNRVRPKCARHVSMQASQTLFMIPKHQQFLLFKTKLELAVHLEDQEIGIDMMAREFDFATR